MKFTVDDIYGYLTREFDDDTEVMYQDSAKRMQFSGRQVFVMVEEKKIGVIWFLTYTITDIESGEVSTFKAELKELSNG